VGGGRKPVEKKPEVVEQLKAILDEQTAGNPMTSQKWVRQSLRQLQRSLHQQGVKLSHETIRRILKQQKYSLKANRKSLVHRGVS